MMIFNTWNAFFLSSLLSLSTSLYLDDDDVTTSGVTLDDVDKRVIFLNRPQPQKFSSNHISTAKYRFAFDFALCAISFCFVFFFV